MLVAGLGIGVVHAILVWGHVLLFWGDTGRWMHEVDRFAGGEVLYRDFTWPFPPLAMWILGGAARLTGTGVHQLWALTAAVYLITVYLFLRYVVRVVPRDLALLTGIVGLVGAMGYAQTLGAPLPMGGYAPAAVVGVMFLLVSLGCLLRRLDGDSGWPSAAGLGLAASLVVLTKQDFWPPALVIVLVGMWLSRGRTRAMIAALAAVPALVGFGVVASNVGWDGLIAMLGGFGHVTERGARGFPSGRLLAAELGALCGALGVGLLLWRPKRSWPWLVVAALAGAVVLAYLENAGRPGLGMLVSDVRLRGLSLFLPGLLLVAVWRSRATLNPAQYRLASVLLIVAMAARVRRGFEGLEWFHVMLELPAEVLSVRLLLGTQRLALQRGVLVALLPLAMQVYWLYGRGPLTLRERAGHESVSTTRGRILLRDNAARDYRFAAEAVAAIDPGGQRPLFAFAYSGGWNYFLSRRNPTPAPQGFRLTLDPPESVLARAVAAQPIVFDARHFTRVQMVDFSAGLSRWEAPMIPTFYMTHDRPYFDRLLAGCRFVTRYPTPGTPFLDVYDCQSSAVAGRRDR